MILGIDHLALSVENTDAVANQLEADGFTCAFMEYGVVNSAEKKMLLDHYQPTHDIGVYKPKKGGVSLEITNHGKIADNDAPYLCHGDTIELFTSDIQAEKNFFKKVFRFKELDGHTLKYTSPVPSWSATVKITEKLNIKKNMLDSKGHACLAFLTNNLEQDIQAAVTAGAKDITNSFKLFLNGRNLEVAMFRTPTGAICELIQIKA